MERLFYARLELPSRSLILVRDGVADTIGSDHRRLNMNPTYFETFVCAVDRCTEKQGILGEEYVIFPPNPDYGYQGTPHNALTFGAMGVDGVHYAILKIDGVVRDDSPVIQICPMDFSDQYQVLAESFLNFLADGCDTTPQKMDAVFTAERTGQPTLAAFLKEHFSMSKPWDEERARKLERYLAMIELKP